MEAVHQEGRVDTVVVAEDRIQVILLRRETIHQVHHQVVRAVVLTLAAMLPTRRKAGTARVR